MPDASAYALAADAILLLHFSFVGFVIGGLIAVLAGHVLNWAWVRNPWFRSAHLAATLYVALQAWAGAICPLTRWEMALREKAGDTVYSGAFIARWLESLLYYRAPEWVFILAYTVFGLLVLACWFWVRPRSFRSP